MMFATDKATEFFEQAVKPLLTRAGLTGPASLHALRGGANNRVMRVDSGGRRYLLKAYHDVRTDGRDRMADEYAFTRFAWSQGVRSVPRPLARDDDRHVGLYTYVEGRPVAPADVTPHAMDQAVAFYRDLNRHRATRDASALPEAAEACFSVSEHLTCVDRRIDRLRSALPSSCPPGARRDASVLVHGELGPLWRRVRCGMMLACTKMGLAIDRALPAEDRRLSPSDFGFHNAIVAPSGRLVFIDFEYAGWDDPAKLVCDFFCQPAVPVPMDFYEPFAELIAADLTDPTKERRRFDLLLPVYRLKWCCILLNEFLADGEARRRFAGASPIDERRLNEQVNKARAALASAEACFTARMG